MFAKAGGLVIAAAVVAALLLVRHNSRAIVVPEPATVLTGDVTTQLAKSGTLDTAVFAGGCFWGIEAVFEHIKGVESSVSGYTGGTLTNPSYEEVTTGRTGHAEAVRVVFDRGLVSYSKLFEKTKVFKIKIVTQVVPLAVFYPAEAYHQDYMAHHPDAMYIVINDAPKVERLRLQFPELYRERQ